MKNEIPKREMLRDIGRNSILSNADVMWLREIATILHEDGYYTKCIYLNRLIGNAGRAKEMEILTHEAASKLAEQRFTAGQGAWDSYVDSNYGLLISWVNKRLINMLEQDPKRNALSFTMDYTLLFGIFNESAPQQPADGLDAICKRLWFDLDLAGWKLTSKTHPDSVIDLTISKQPEPVAMAPAKGSWFTSRFNKK